MLARLAAGSRPGRWLLLWLLLSGKFSFYLMIKIVLGSRRGAFLGALFIKPIRA